MRVVESQEISQSTVTRKKKPKVKKQKSSFDTGDQPQTGKSKKAQMDSSEDSDNIEPIAQNKNVPRPDQSRLFLEKKKKKRVSKKVQLEQEVNMNMSSFSVAQKTGFNAMGSLLNKPLSIFNNNIRIPMPTNSMTNPYIGLNSAPHNPFGNQLQNQRER